MSNKEIQIQDNKYVTEDDMWVISYVFNKLNQYDNADDKPKSNPYKEKIVVISEDGKEYEIPEEVRKYAVHKWKETKGITNDSFGNDVMQMIICLFIVFVFMYFLSSFRRCMKRVFGEHE